MGFSVLAGTLAVLTALSRFYPDARNPAGSRAGVACIFLFAFLYSYFFNSAIWVIVGEIFPLHLRARGNGFAVASQAVTAIWLSYAASVAFERIAWRFYFVFIGANVGAAVCCWVWLPETNQLTLEEVAAAFGDETVVRGVGKGEADGGEGTVAHLEDVGEVERRA